MNIKKIIIFILAIGLVFGESYLIASLIIDKMNKVEDVQNFCQLKCNYNPDSSYWEFSGEYSTKGFTTENECFNYCSKVRQGFAYFLTEYAPAFLSNFFNKLR